MEWTIEMVVDPSGMEQEFPGTGDAGSPDRNWDMRASTCQLLGIQFKCNLEGIVYLAVEHAPLLGEF